MNVSQDPSNTTTALHAGWRRRERVLHAYLVLPHAVPTLIVLATTAGFAVIAADGVPRARRLAELLLAMLGAQITIGTVNDLVDRDTDRQVKPTKPIPAGAVTVHGAAILTIVSVVVMIVFSARFGWLSLALCLLGTGLGVAYSLWFKRSLFASAPYFLALPLLPIWVFTALDRFDSRLFLLYPLGAPAVVGIHVSQSITDVAADRISGIRNLTSVLGERRSIRLAWGSVLASVASAVCVSAFTAERPGVIWGAGIFIAIVIVTNVLMFQWRPHLGIKACFPTVAASTAVLSLAWVIAIRG